MIRCMLWSISVIVVCLASTWAVGAGEWARYRGPGGDGHAAGEGLPRTWSETQHVRWKTAIPGKGWSSPVVWDDQVWLTTALEDGRSLRAICVDFASGALIYNIELFTPPKPGAIHQMNSFASPTPVIDAERVYCHFGNFGIAAIDRKTGSVAWRNEQFKDVIYTVGPGSSPVLYGNLYIVHCDGINQRFLLALDKATGKVAWKKDRSNPIKKTQQHEKSFSTPLIIRHSGKDVLISQHADAITAYDPTTGDELWQLKYEGYSNVAAPVAGHGMLFVNTGYDFPQFWALKLGEGQGKPEVAWKITRGIGPRVGPLLVGDELYLVSDDGIVQCLDARTGEPHYKERIGGQFCATPLFVDGRIYLFDQAGVTTVLAPGKSFNRLAQNKLGSGFMASPAVAGKALILRSKTHLYRIEE